MATDIVYFARIDMTALAIAQDNAAKAINTGNYQADSLYIISEKILPQITKSLNQNSDLLMIVDNFIVLAPGWKNFAVSPLKINFTPN